MATIMQIPYLSGRLSVNASGRVPRPVLAVKLLEVPSLKPYGSQCVYESLRYLHQKGLIRLKTDRSAPLVSAVPEVFPMPVTQAPGKIGKYRIASVTPAGNEFSAVLCKDTVWKKLLSKFGKTALEALISGGVKIISDLLL